MIHAGVENRDQVGVRQAEVQLDLAPEAALELTVRIDDRRQHLEGDQAAEARLASAEHRSQAALSEQRFDRVAGEPLSRPEGHSTSPAYIRLPPLIELITRTWFAMDTAGQPQLRPGFTFSSST